MNWLQRLNRDAYRAVPSELFWMSVLLLNILITTFSLILLFS